MLDPRDGFFFCVQMDRQFHERRSKLAQMTTSMMHPLIKTRRKKTNKQELVDHLIANSSVDRCGIQQNFDPK
jgi:hypothetical protein